MLTWVWARQDTDMAMRRTGASGYIGGEALHRLATAHPEYSIRALIRNDAHGSAITQAYKNIEPVKGSLADAEVLAREATEADVVLSEP